MEDSSATLARIAASSTLTSVAAQVSGTMDAFVSWSLAAFATGIGIIVANLPSLSSFIHTSEFARTGFIFLWMFLVCICQKYVASIISGSAAAGAEAAKVAEKIIGMDASIFFAELLRGCPWPMRLLLKKVEKTGAMNDFAFGGRILIRLAFLHTILVTIYTLLSAWCLAVIFEGIRPN